MRQTLLSPALRHCNKCGIFRSALIVVTPHRRSGRMHATRLHDSSTNGCGYEQSELRSGHRHLRFQNGDLALPFRDHQSNRAPADFPQKAPFLYYVGRQSRLEPPRSMQPLMYDQPQPTCNRIKDDGAERGHADHHSSQEDRLPKPSVWIGREHFPNLPGRVPSLSIHYLDLP